MPVTGTPKEKIEGELHRFKHGELHSGSAHGPIVKDRAQAVAIALSVAGKSRPQRAWGGGIANEHGGIGKGGVHTGPIHSQVPGRTDHIPMSVPNGSYVLPSSHVAHLGQDNSAAGHARLNHMMSGILAKAGGGLPHPPRAPGFATGGASSKDDDGKVDILAAGGEYVVKPEIVLIIGAQAAVDAGIKEPTHKQAMDMGHTVLDHWVTETRKKHIKTLKNLPGPAKK